MVVMLCCTVDVFIVTELQMLNIIKTINLGAWGMVQAKEQLPSMQAQSSVLPTAKKKMINLMCILSQLKKKVSILKCQWCWLRNYSFSKEETVSLSGHLVAGPGPGAKVAGLTMETSGI
jgi:hypothetical protein